MNDSEKVAQVYDLMGELDVSLSDLELWSHVSALGDDDEMDEDPDNEWPQGVAGAYDALKAARFDLDGDSHAAAHYWQTTRDHVSNTLESYGLRVARKEPS